MCSIELTLNARKCFRFSSVPWCVRTPFTDVANWFHSLRMLCSCLLEPNYKVLIFLLKAHLFTYICVYVVFVKKIHSLQSTICIQTHNNVCHSDFNIYVTRLFFFFLQSIRFRVHWIQKSKKKKNGGILHWKNFIFSTKNLLMYHRIPKRSKQATAWFDIYFVSFFMLLCSEIFIFVCFTFSQRGWKMHNISYS